MKTPSNIIRHTLLTVASLALLAVASSGCGSLRLRTPDGFARLPDQAPNYQLRSVSADGVVLAVRAQPNRVEGSLAFWSEAIDRTVRADANYVGIATAEVHTTAGLAGRRLEYVVGDAATGHRYWIAVFVTHAQVYVIETGGAHGPFDRARPELERAIRSFSPG